MFGMGFGWLRLVWVGKKKKLKSLAMAHSFSLERRFPLLMECF